MSTPYPSLDMPSGQKNDPYLVDQEAPSIGNAEKDALIEESQQQSRSPKNHFQTMSPRIPRKRMLPNNVNYAKEVRLQTRLFCFKKCTFLTGGF